jgi:hypothetical protein
MYGLMTKRMTRFDTVDVQPRAQTYGQCVTGNFIFTSRPIAPVSLLWSCALVEI